MGMIARRRTATRDNAGEYSSLQCRTSCDLNVLPEVGSISNIIMIISRYAVLGDGQLQDRSPTGILPQIARVIGIAEAHNWKAILPVGGNSPSGLVIRN